MSQSKKRPSKSAKAAQKILKESKLLADLHAAKAAGSGEEFKSSAVISQTNTTANKPRPHKKRG